MLERLIHLIMRLKEILFQVGEQQKESNGNEIEIKKLPTELASLKQGEIDAMKALDELEEVIIKWES